MPSRSRPPKRPWWGETPVPPHEEWPRATINIPAEWSSLRRRWETHGGKYFFDRAAAMPALDFYPMFLKHSIGGFAGQAFTLLPYQDRTLTRPLFGWRRTSDGLRRFRKVTLFAPKGAGKSPWGGGTGLYLTFFDHEPAAEVVALARDREQARVVFRDAQLFVEQSPELASRCDVLRDSIFVPSTGSVFKVLSAEASGRHGWRPSAVILDELQEQPTRDLLEVAIKSMPKRRQPVLILMGHAGTDQESVGFEERAYAKAVIDGTLQDEALLPVVFEARESDDWRSEDTWRKANPGYGITVQPEGIAQEAREAANEPRKLNDFKRYHLNIWTNQATAWLPLEWWDHCQTPPLDPARFRAYDCYGGLDMAQSIDYASFVVGVRVPMTDTATVIEVTDETGTSVRQSLDYGLALFPYFWLPEDRLREREREDGLPLSLYRARGQLFTSPGATISAEQVWRDITQTIAPTFPRLRTIGYDPAFAFDLAQRLSASHTTIPIPQNYNFFSAPSCTLEGLLKGKRVQQDGHPILRWNVSNVAVKRDEAGRIKPVKPKSIGQARKRIDGVVATLMALGVLQREAPAVTPNYEIYFIGGRR